MSLLAQIKSAQLQARKNKDTVQVSLLTTLIGDAAMVGKNNGNRESTDAEVVATIKKFINNTIETLQQLPLEAPKTIRVEDQESWTAQNDLRRAVLVRERAILESYMPKQLSGSELEALIDEIINTWNGSATLKDMGNVIKEIKARTQGNCDMSAASALVKQKLSK